MSPKLSRTQANAIVAQLLETKRAINRDFDELITALQAIAGNTRVPRNYDMPVPDAEVIAKTWGVDLADDPEGTIPEWVQARIAKHLPENE